MMDGFLLLVQNLSFKNLFSHHRICLLCENQISFNSIFCLNCYNNLDFVTNIYSESAYFINNQNICDKLANKKNWFLDETTSLFLYRNSGKKIIAKIKKSNDQYLYKYLIKLTSNIKKNFFHNIDLIIPIPIHWITKLLRGFNQSALISEELSNFTNIKLAKNILIKNIYTKKQSMQIYNNRFSNIKNSYLIKNYDIIRNKNILLVDDVITTGATSNECAKLLKENGAKLVKLFTISKTILSKNCNEY
jgi:competence protein ComFC